jgi:uncharacterized protein YggU (UPF0235/DUF167 family)
MTIRVHVHARANKNEFKEAGGDLHVYVTAPPVQHKANLAVRDLLAEKFSVPKSSVILVRGARSPIKEFEI